MKIIFLTVICVIALIEVSIQTCPFEQVPGNPGRFQTKTSPHIPLDCPLASPTTKLVFNELICACDYATGIAPIVSVPKNCNGDAVLVMKFDESLADSSCNKLFVSPEVPVIYDALNGRHEPSLELQPNNPISIPYFSGRYLNRNVSFSVSVFIRPNVVGFLEDNIIDYNCPGNGNGLSKIKLGYVQSITNWNNVRGQLQNNFGVTKTVKSDENLVPLNFTHVALTFDQRYLKLFVDGVLKDLQPLEGGVANADCPLIIHLDGQGKVSIDNLEIYDRALSLSDIVSLKNQNI
jgi:hypothetical protein